MLTFIKNIKNTLPEINIAYHTYQEIYIEFNGEILNFEYCKNQLEAIYYNQKIAIQAKAKIWNIPICYDQELVPDLNNYLVRKKLTFNKLISLHSEVLYRIQFIGFLPGFLYLSGMSHSLSIDRKKVPSKLIQKGTVAIGGEQTGIYPQDSPGGWYGIGYTPISFFNAKENPPVWAKAGDYIQFSPVNRKELLNLEKQIASGCFILQNSKYEG